MTLFKFYRYRNSAIIPTMVLASNNLLVEGEPVEIVEIDHPELKNILLEALAKPATAEPPQQEDDDGPKSVVLEALKLRKWREFEQNALLFTVYRSQTGVEIHVTGRGDDGFWKRDDTAKIALPPEAWPTTVAAALASTMREKQPVQEKQVRLLGGGPPPPALPPPRD